MKPKAHVVQNHLICTNALATQFNALSRRLMTFWNFQQHSDTADPGLDAVNCPSAVIDPARE